MCSTDEAGGIVQVKIYISTLALVNPFVRCSFMGTKPKSGETVETQSVKASGKGAEFG